MGKLLWCEGSEEVIDLHHLTVSWGSKTERLPHPAANFPTAAMKAAG